MEAFSLLGTGFEQLFQPIIMGALVVGLLLGLVIGVIPGVGGTTGVAVLLPLTVLMPPTAALVMLAAIYWGALYGGSIASILFGVPGNPWSVATMFDGRPMARMGQAALALALAFAVSFVGAILASLLFTTFALPFAGIALRFGPPEQFAILLIAFGTFVGMGGNPFKALVMMAVGFLLASVGLDVITGQPRLNYGTITLMQGFHFVPVTIALFGIGEILANAAERYKLKIEVMAAASRLGLGDVVDAIRRVIRHGRLVLFSSLMGFFVGVLPGAGATPSSFIAYGLARRFSRNPERFGQGEPTGVMAPEAANNAAGTGAILPLLVLGIPGSPTAAVIMAGIFMWGFIPGPRLFTENVELVWPFIASLYVANVLAVIICMSATPILASILRTPYGLLVPIIAMLSILGAWAIRFSEFDVWLMILLGFLGFVLRRLNYPLAPLVVALVLGFPTETAFRQTLIMGGGSPLILFSRPIAAASMVIAILFFFLPVLQVLLRGVIRRVGAKVSPA
ncbi:MAG: tripartite tricarboxylate transporter permease [Dehalococcoidia bacterium]